MNDDQRIELEIRLAHQEHLIQLLNEEVTRQGDQIRRLEQISKILIERIQNIGEGVHRGIPADEVPPHY